jgi:hypothetical protein
MFRWLRRSTTHLSEDKRRITEALLGYPPYSPPDWNPDTKSFQEANIEYMTFFFDNLVLRKEALRVFLSKFDTVLNFDDSSVLAVSAWCPRYADLLVDDLQSELVWSAYHRFDAPWIGPLLGLNAIFDLGVYFGECLLSLNSRLKWEPLRAPDGGMAGHPIFGQRGHRPFDPMKWIYVECKNIRAAKLAQAMRLVHRPGNTFLSGTRLYKQMHAQSTA